MKDHEMSISEARAILGLGQFHTEEELKRAYKAKIKENHPDLQPKDEYSQKAASKRMMEVNEAYKVLKAELNNSAVQQTDRQSQPSWTRNNTSPTSAQQQSEPDYFASSPEDDEEEEYESSKLGTPLYRGVRKVIEKFPMRIAFILLAVFLFEWRTGGSILDPWAAADPGVTLAVERVFFYLGLVMVSGINLFVGTMTNACRKSMLWAWDKTHGFTPVEYSLRHAIFGHLPYRIMFVVASALWYCDLAWHVNEGGPLDWPIRCLVFAVAAFNFIWPLVTNFVRDVLTGAPSIDD